MATIKGLTIEIGADFKQFNRQIKAVDREINSTNRQVNELAKSLELEFDASRFAEAQKLAQKALDQTNLKAKALRDELAYLERSGHADTEGYRKLQTELVKTEAKAVLLKNKLEEIKDLKLENVVQQFEKLGGGITKIGQALAPLSAAAAGLLGSFAAIGLSAVSAADDVQTLADRVNLSAEAMQRWSYIAMQTDVSVNELQTAFIKTQGALAKLSQGAGGPGAAALERLGISMQQAALGMDANIDLIITRLASLEDPVLQAALANELFGERMGAKLIPLLQAGGEGLAQLTEEFELLGYMTNEQVKQFAEFDNVMNTIKYSFGMLRNELGAALLPVMQSLADFLREKVIPAVQRFADWFSTLSEQQIKLILGFSAFVAAAAPALIVIGKITAGVGGLVKTVNALGKAFTFLSAHPIIAVIAGIAALIIYLYNTNEQFRESVNELVKALGEALMPILQVLIDIFKSLFVMLGNVLNIFANALVPAFRMLTSVIIPVVNLISKVLTPVIQFFGDTVTRVFGAVEKVIRGIIGFIEDLINKLIDAINFIIRQVNKLTDLFGVTVKEIERVKLLSEGSAPEAIKPEAPAAETPENILSQTQIMPAPQTYINNDYSSKDIKVEVIVENYAEHVDVDDLVRQINIKLAEAL